MYALPHRVVSFICIGAIRQQQRDNLQACLLVLPSVIQKQLTLQVQKPRLKPTMMLVTSEPRTARCRRDCIGLLHAVGGMQLQRRCCMKAKRTVVLGEPQNCMAPYLMVCMNSMIFCGPVQRILRFLCFVGSK